MPRIARMVLEGEQAVYHVMSRTALDGFPFGDVEKEAFVRIIRNFSGLFFVEVLGLCIMGNHFHLLVRMLPESDFSDREIRKRFESFYGKERTLGDGQIPMLREKLSRLSDYMKSVKHGFTCYFNKRHQRRGTLWGERFKSVIVENGETLINCLAYIDLNPVRAGIVDKPEDYRWNSIGYHVQADNKDGFLSLDFGLKEFNVLDSSERLRRYRRFLYEKGAQKTEKGVQIEGKTLEKERNRAFKLSKADRFAYRTRYFSDSGIIGTREFVKKNYQRFKHLFQSKEKIPKRIAGLDGVYSLKRLTESSG